MLEVSVTKPNGEKWHHASLVAGTPGTRPKGTSRHEGLPHGSLPAMPEPLAALDAFLQEHRRCGESPSKRGVLTA